MFGYRKFGKALLNDLDAAQRMIEDKHIDVNKRYKLSHFQECLHSPLEFAIEERNLRAVHFLLDQGAHPNPKINSVRFNPLYCAARICHGQCREEDEAYDILKLLLEKRADCNERIGSGCVTTPFLRALAVSSLKAVEMLLNYGADIKALGGNSRTALHCAAENRCTGVLQVVLDQGFDIDCSDSQGCTALHIPCS